MEERNVGALGESGGGVGGGVGAAAEVVDEVDFAWELSVTGSGVGVGLKEWGCTVVQQVVEDFDDVDGAVQAEEGEVDVSVSVDVDGGVDAGEARGGDDGGEGSGAEEEGGGEVLHFDG